MSTIRSISLWLLIICIAALSACAPATPAAQNQGLPFSEVIKVILKVSMNRGADTLVFLLAVHEGKRTFDDGLAAIKPFLDELGVDASAISLGDGRGNDSADLFSPRSVTALLRAMASRPEAAAYYDALPILGVDGTEWQALPETSPARGHIVAKSGTTIDGDLMNQEYLLLGKASAGYLTAKSGRGVTPPSAAISGTSPDVDTVMRRGDKPSPCDSHSTRTARVTSSKL